MARLCPGHPRTMVFTPCSLAQFPRPDHTQLLMFSAQSSWAFGPSLQQTSSNALDAKQPASLSMWTMIRNSLRNSPPWSPSGCREVTQDPEVCGEDPSSLILPLTGQLHFSSACLVLKGKPQAQSAVTLLKAHDTKPTFAIQFNSSFHLSQKSNLSQPVWSFLVKHQ